MAVVVPIFDTCFTFHAMVMLDDSMTISAFVFVNAELAGVVFIRGGWDDARVNEPSCNPRDVEIDQDHDMDNKKCVGCLIWVENDE